MKLFLICVTLLLIGAFAVDILPAIAYESRVNENNRLRLNNTYLQNELLEINEKLSQSVAPYVEVYVSREKAIYVMSVLIYLKYRVTYGYCSMVMRIEPNIANELTSCVVRHTGSITPSNPCEPPHIVVSGADMTTFMEYNSIPTWDCDY